MPDTRFVCVVDDDRAVRDSMLMMLNTAGYPVKAFATAEEFLEEYVPEETACLILDIRMPGKSGLELQEHLNSVKSKVPVVFVSGHGDVPVSVRAIKGGALDFLEKPFSRETLLRRVQEALEISHRRRASEQERKKLLQRFDRLTPREREVLLHVVAGRQNKEIARLLEISYRTVELHRTRMMEKMSAQSLPELVAMAVRCGVHEIGAPPNS
ncbi:MAG: response regulator transcription factor [Gammaproteobacteria bacterium]|nr:response regulator transcription factor [Gammaproteobacteria bacterium]